MFIEPPPETEDVKELRIWCHKLQQQLLGDDIHVAVSWDPGSVASGEQSVAGIVNVPGAQLGDYAIASFSLDVADLVLDAQVTAEDTVSCVLSNNTADAVDLAYGTLYVRVLRRTT